MPAKRRFVVLLIPWSLLVVSGRVPIVYYVIITAVFMIPYESVVNFIDWDMATNKLGW